MSNKQKGNFLQNAYSWKPNITNDKYYQSNDPESPKIHTNRLFPAHKFQDSIKNIKSKIEHIQGLMKQKAKQSPQGSPLKLKISPESRSEFRKTQPFKYDHCQSPKSTKISIKQSSSCHELLSKANQSIRKSYQLSGKLTNNLPQSPKIKAKDESSLNTSVNIMTLSSCNLSNNSIFKRKSFNTSFVEENPLYISPKHEMKWSLNNRSTESSTEEFNGHNKKGNIPFTKPKSHEHSSSVSQLLNLSKIQCQPQIHKKQDNISNGFQFVKLLGQGKFGQVYLARHLQTGFIVAVKRVSKAKLVEYKMVDRFKEEILLHRKLDHPNIVKFYGFFEEKQNICLVLQYLSGGTLFDYQNNIGTLSVKQAVGFLREIIQALTYLHETYIVHRDIKPQNIVISSTGMAKLCDFGWSTVIQSARTTFCGTLDYASPQILQRKQYDWSVDVWCVGILTYQLLVGRSPFQHYDRQQVMQGIINVDKSRLPYIQTIPPQARQFIEAILQKDPLRRPKMSQLLEYPLFTENVRKHKNSTN